MKRRTKIILMWGAGLLAAIVLGGLAVVGLWVYIYTHPSGHTTDITPVDYVIGGHKFRIPRAYVVEREKWSGGAVSSVYMHAFLPGFKPFGEDTRHLYPSKQESRRSPAGKLPIVWVGIESVDEDDPPPGVKWSQLTEAYRARCRPAKLGYLLCPTDNRGFPDEVELVKQADERKYAYICEPETRITASCRGHFPLSDGVILRVGFKYRQLVRAEEFVAGAYRLVCGFHRGSAGRSVTYDYCNHNPYLTYRSKE